MKEQESAPDLSLFGGPLHRLGCRLGLVREGTNTLWVGVALGLLAWGVLAALTLLQGAGPKVFSLGVIAVHVRLLVAIPLFFLCEVWVLPRMTEFASDIVRSGLVPESELPGLASVIRRIGSLKDSWLAEVLFVLAAFALPLIGTIVELPGRTANFGALLAENGGRPGPILFWYLGFCLPLFRFLLLRWVWRLALWCYFLWRVAKLKLRLLPIHPDGVAGLGYLEVVQEHFTPLACAASAVYAASFAEDIASGSMAFEALYRLIPIVLLLVAALFIGPLFLFAPKLWLCRITGLSEYMRMASSYVNSFDRKWIRGENTTNESLLGTPDMQSLADLTNSVNVVHNMRIIPADRRLIVQLAASVMLPLLPLVFFKYPVSDVAAKLFQTLTGL